jgi:hypothetical protein
MAFTMPKMHKDTNPFCLGALAGALLLGWVGFDALHWKTESATESIAKRRAELAVVDAFAHICSAQFSDAKNVTVRLDDLKKADRYARGDLVAKAGFATMTGEKEPTSGVSQACAELLVPEKS